MKSHQPYNAKIRCLPLLLLSAGMVAPATLSATPDQEGFYRQQDILQRQRQEQQREQLQPKSDVRLYNGSGTDESALLQEGINTSSTADTSGGSLNCFTIQDVVLTGEHHRLFQSALKRALAQTHFQAGKCLNAGDINQIMTAAQNVMIGRGYTTTRILAAPQDLNSGKLTLTVFPGYLKNIEIDLSDSGHTHAERIAAFQNEFPMRSDGILNLRDLEQGLENLKRIPTAEADIQIVPVAGVPNQSAVSVKWRQKLLPYRLNVGIDNSGSKETGKY